MPGSMTTPSTSRTYMEAAEPLLSSSEGVQEEDVESLSSPALNEYGDHPTLDVQASRQQRAPGFWTRLQMSMRRKSNGVTQSTSRTRSLAEEKRWKVSRRKKYCVGVPLAIVFFFGLVHLFDFFLGYVPLLWDDPDAALLDWTRSGQPSSDIAAHLLDITHDVTPIPCHSHNDYWRRVPLYDALRWGCTGVEADVWLSNDDLFVGHSTSALKAGKTFRSMYVDPLVKMLDHKNQLDSSTSIKNGVFETAPEQTLVLLVDFKNDGHEIFPYVSQQLQSLRSKGYLTYYDGNTIVERPITVVATGNAPFDFLIANSTYRDIFFDAPLDRLYEPATVDGSSTMQTIVDHDGQGTVGTSPNSTFDFTNSYYASGKFTRAVGIPFFTLSNHQLDLIRGQVRGAHARGLKARYWSTPKWPIGLRNKIWQTLVEEGVDYLNGDDLRGMTRVDWGIRRHWSLIGRKIL